MTASAGRVRFDFAGSLAQAKRLWALAEHLDGLKTARTADAELALRSWRGQYAGQFRTRMTDEATSLGNVAEGLRSEARAWAQSWKDAMDLQNRRNRAQQVEAVRARRSWTERNIGDLFQGDDSDQQVAPAPVAAVPQPPEFQPTCTEVRY